MLSEHEIDALFQAAPNRSDGWLYFARAIEAKVMEKQAPQAAQPDHIPDAGKMVEAQPVEPDNFPVNWATMLHYPDCWDTAAYPTLRDAIHEALAWSGCSVCKPQAQPVEPVWFAVDTEGADFDVSFVNSYEQAKELIDCTLADNTELKASELITPLYTAPVAHTEVLRQALGLLEALNTPGENYDHDGCFQRWDEFNLDGIIAKARAVLGVGK